MKFAKKKSLKLYLLIFVLTVLASGWIGVFLDSLLTNQPEGNTLGMGLWLILPFLVSILLRVISRDWNLFWHQAKFERKLYMVFHCTTYLSIRYSNNDKHIAHFWVAHISSFDISTLLSLIVMSTIGNFIKIFLKSFLGVVI